MSKTLPLSPFYGEFFVNPIPLELSGNWCSHNCIYCFANLNTPNRQGNVKKTLSLIENAHSRKSLEGQLLTLGYPVVISNHVDPFAVTNYQNMLIIMEKLVKKNIPIMIQTKGGKGVNDVLRFLPPSVWYISISHQSDQTRKAIERGAPSIEERFELIKLLKKHNHRVVVGINPLVPDWIPDLKSFLFLLKNIGVEGVWIEILHLNYKQRNNISPYDKKKLGDTLIKKAMKLTPSPDFLEHFNECRDIAESFGLEIFSIGQANKSNFFKPYKETYPKLFPVMQDWVNHCCDQNISQFDFDDWFSFFAHKLPIINSPSLYHYIESGTQRHQFDFKIPKINNYQDLLSWCWKSEKFKRANPIQNHGCSYLAETQNGQIVPILKHELPTFAYSRNGTSYKYLIVNERSV